jgi:hypothetical protein
VDARVSGLTILDKAEEIQLIHATNGDVGEGKRGSTTGHTSSKAYSMMGLMGLGNMDALPECGSLLLND